MHTHLGCGLVQYWQGSILTIYCLFDESTACSESIWPFFIVVHGLLSIGLVLYSYLILPHASLLPLTHSFSLSFTISHSFVILSLTHYIFTPLSIILPLFLTLLLCLSFSFLFLSFPHILFLSNSHPFMNFLSFCVCLFPSPKLSLPSPLPPSLPFPPFPPSLPSFLSLPLPLFSFSLYLPFLSVTLPLSLL